MSLVPQFIGVLQLLVGVLSLLFLKPALKNPTKRGSRSFQLFTVSVAIYAFCSGTDLFVADRTVSLWVYNLELLGGVLMGLAWLLLAIEVTERIRITRRLIAGLAGYTILSQLLVWTNPIHHLVLDSTTSINSVNNLVLAREIGFWVLLGITYLLVLVGTALLAVEAIQTTGIRRKQMSILSLALIPTFVGSFILMVFNQIVQYDSTVFGYVGTAILFALALFNSRFLDIEPVARRIAIDAMEDATVTLDTQNRVIDCNRSARELFDIQDEYYGMAATDFFAVIPSKTRLRLSDATNKETDITVAVEGEQRHFTVSVSPIGENGLSGSVLVFHETTRQIRRERQLEKKNEQLDQFADIVSHDLRNPLSVARGYFDMSRDNIDDDHAEKIDRNLGRMEEMIEDLLTMSRAGMTVKELDAVTLRTLATESWESAQTSTAELDLQMSENITFNADRERLMHVFENIFRNTVDHNDSPLTIRVGVLETMENGVKDVTGFFIEDDGDGIPANEREAVFDHGYSTSDNGTGFGLSIVKQIVDAHGWEVSLTEAVTGGVRFEFYVDNFTTETRAD